jgi:hypothetical protein
MRRTEPFSQPVPHKYIYVETGPGCQRVSVNGGNGAVNGTRVRQVPGSQVPSSR